MGLFGFGRQGYGDAPGYGGGRSGGFPMRIVIAVVIAGIGLVTYLSHTQVNPVTGEKQHIAMSVDQEKTLGLQAAPKMADQMGGALDPRTDPDARIVAEVGSRLIKQTEAGKSPYANNFNFYLLNDPQTINAFALPGGQIFITRGLYSKLQDESQLAGVLGHEIGHVIHRHSAQQLAKGQLGQMLVVATGVGASDDRGHGQMAAAAAAMANQMAQLKYGRGDESQSDEYGLKLMAQAGYDPRGMLAVMEVLKAASAGSRQPEFLSSHPLPQNRLDEIKQQIARQYPNGVPENLTRGRSLGGGSRLVDDRRAPAPKGQGDRW